MHYTIAHTHTSLSSRSHACFAFNLARLHWDRSLRY